VRWTGKSKRDEERSGMLPHRLIWENSMRRKLASIAVIVKEFPLYFHLLEFILEIPLI
jgi:hypothetical protein